MLIYVLIKERRKFLWFLKKYRATRICRQSGDLRHCSVVVYHTATYAQRSALYRDQYG
jgi:hypothetical protein